MSRLRSYARINPRSDKKAATDAADRPVRAHVRARSGGRCEVALDGARCPRRAWEQHHVVKRSQGGPTTVDNLIDICRDDHDRTDWPWTRGRLHIEALGREQFACAILTKKPGR